LAVHSTQTAKAGDIVVARIDDEVTVKRFQKGKQSYQVTLLPENQDYQPIEVDLRTSQFAIEGLAVGVIRH
jgi:repressor LexA